VTSADLDQLFKQMKKYIADIPNTSGLNIEDLEAKMSASTKEVQNVRDQLSHTISSLTSRVDNLSEELKIHNDKLSNEIQRQNVINPGMQQ
jgi:septal ring factor EnvC (AmiA/AmiB activator)